MSEVIKTENLISSDEYTDDEETLLTPVPYRRSPNSSDTVGEEEQEEEDEHEEDEDDDDDDDDDGDDDGDDDDDVVVAETKPKEENGIQEAQFDLVKPVKQRRKFIKKSNIAFKKRSIKWFSNIKRRNKYKEHLLNIHKMDKATVEQLREMYTDNNTSTSCAQPDDNEETAETDNTVPDPDPATRDEERPENLAMDGGNADAGGAASGAVMVTSNGRPSTMRLLERNEEIQEKAQENDAVGDSPSPSENPRATKRPRMESTRNEDPNSDGQEEDRDQDIRNSFGFYREINKLYPKHEEQVGKYVQSCSANMHKIDEKLSRLLIEMDQLNEMLEKRESELNRLMHLRQVKEEIYNRLARIKAQLVSKETTFDRATLIDLKEMEVSLSDTKEETDSTKGPQSTVAKLVEKRAKMNRFDLEKERENINRIERVLIATNILPEKRVNRPTVGSAEPDGERNFRNNLPSASGSSSACQLPKMSLPYQYLEDSASSRVECQKPPNNMPSMISDFDQNEAEVLTRVASTHHNRIQLNEPNNYSRERKRTFSSHQTEVYRIRMKESSNYRKQTVEYIQNNNAFRENESQQICQQCKIRESRFLCGGCGNQWYCSRRCQINAWDNHSDNCHENNNNRKHQIRKPA